MRSPGAPPQPWTSCSRVRRSPGSTPRSYTPTAPHSSDLGSASGTFVDGVQIAANKAHALAEGAVITLGECKTTYTYRLSAKAKGATKRKR